MEISQKALKQSSEFKPKLTYADRCAVLALINKNVSVRVIAAAFDINRRTVTHLRNGFRGYKKMHDECSSMGKEAFEKKYLTEDHIARINATADDPALEQSYSDYDSTSGDRTQAPSRRSSGMAGINFLKHPSDEISHRIEIAWLEANTAEDASGPFEHPAGWYWRDLDSYDKYWNGNPDENSHVSSQKAFNHARSEFGV